MPRQLEIDPDTATLEELESEYAWLRDEILAIDSDLLERRNGFHKKEIPAAEYWDWRAGAVRAKNIKVRQIGLIGSRLRILRRESQLKEREKPREQWRLKCFALIDALEELRAMELPPEAADRVDEAVIAFRGSTL